MNDALKIKRTPDSIEINDAHMRKAVAEYVKRTTGRVVAFGDKECVQFHPTSDDNQRSGAKKHWLVYTTVLLEDLSPREQHMVAEADDGLDEMVNALRDGRVLHVTQDIIAFLGKLVNMNSTLAGGSKLHQDFEIDMKLQFRTLMRSFRTANLSKTGRHDPAASDEDEFE